jgi:hypothetical protein
MTAVWVRGGKDLILRLPGHKGRSAIPHERRTSHGDPREQLRALKRVDHGVATHFELLAKLLHVQTSIHRTAKSMAWNQEL